MKKSTSALVLGFLAFLLLHCARQGSPTGGAKDTTPPRLDSLRSTPNYSVRFQQKTIELRFDEWLSLNNPGTELTVSPPLNKKPEMTLKGKTVLLEFNRDEQLRPNTTYTLNFGASIKDFHEGNPVKDLLYVFSTGDVLDSLRIRGYVKDAISDEPVENISVMLYDNFTDSIVRKEKPYYWAKTNKEGFFTVYNIRAGQYKVVAFEDTNPDLKWGGESERIAFADSSIVIDSSNARNPVNLKLFKNKLQERLIDRNANSYGLVKLGFTQRPESIEVRPLEPVPGMRTSVEAVQDSLYFRYDLETPIAWKLLAGKDTISVTALNRAEFLKNRKISFADAPIVNKKGNRPNKAAPAPPGNSIKISSVYADQAAVLEFNSPVSAIDSSKWALSLGDSVTVPILSIAFDSASPRKIRLNAAWKAEKQHQLVLLPGAIRDFYGVDNTDTLRRNLLHQSEKQLAGIKLTISALKPGAAYLLQILNGNTVEKEKAFRAESAEQTLRFEQMPVATYGLKLVIDANNNGKWDTGSYFDKKQPERIINKKLEALRAGFETEATMSTDDSTAKSKKK